MKRVGGFRLAVPCQLWVARPLTWHVSSPRRREHVRGDESLLLWRMFKPWRTWNMPPSRSAQCAGRRGSSLASQCSRAVEREFEGECEAAGAGGEVEGGDDAGGLVDEFEAGLRAAYGLDGKDE